MGCPWLVIDETFLRWAYTYRLTSGIAAFLRVLHPVVRNALLEYGIVEPGENLFIQILLLHPESSTTNPGVRLPNPIDVSLP